MVERNSTTPPAADVATGTTMAILIAISGSHLLNDLLQSVVLATYPVLKESFHLTFAEIGLITLANLTTAALLQPVVGAFTDRHPLAYSLSVGMGFTLIGLLVLSTASGLPMLLMAAALIGIGSSIFHPEASRIARLASGGRHGFAQSLFQVGGNIGSSLGPVLAACIIIPRGQESIRWFSLVALLAMVVLLQVGRWYQRQRTTQTATIKTVPAPLHALPTSRMVISLIILGLLIFSKYCYLTSLTNFYPFYLMGHFQLSAESAQLHLFMFLAAVAAGTIIGGPIGDRIGRKRVIWASILGVAPFTLALPYANLLGTEVLSVIIGMILASAFSAILVYAQELLPGRVGMVSGLFFGFAFGVGGIAAAGLGALADRTSLVQVYQWCSWLPLIGLITAFLPDIERSKS